MPEPPDFDQIACALLDAEQLEPSAASIAQQLRQVWNARGAADLEAFRSVGNSSPGDIVRAIKALDR